MKRTIVFGLLATLGCVAVFVVWNMNSAASFDLESKQVRNDLKLVMLALHNYHDEYRSFPPAFVVGPDGKRWHSWRSLILKDIDPELAGKYRFDEPWNGPNNSKLHKQAPVAFQSDLAESSDSAAHYLAIIGRRTVWPADQTVGFRDLVRGRSNTLMLVENRESEICWLAPKDMLGMDALRMLDDSRDEQPNRGAYFALMDGSVRTVGPKVSRNVLGSLMTASSRDLYQGDEWPTDLIASIPSGRLSEPRGANELSATEIGALRSTPFAVDSNRLWCASLQLAWDDLKQKLGGDIIPVTPNSHIQAMNKEVLNGNLVSPSALFQGTSDGSPTAEANLQRSLDQRFPDIKYRLQLTDRRPVIRVVAAIRKQMPFEEEFSLLDTGLIFQNGKQTSVVENFGYEPTGNGVGPVYESQLTIVDDKGDDNFIVRLKTVGPQQDHIYLAMIPPKPTLDATWRETKRRSRVASRRSTLEANETFRVPVLDFSVFQRFPKLQVPIHVGGEQMPISVVYQDVRLRLDETGADFASVAEILPIASFEDEEPIYDPNRIRNLVFDEPFFVAFIEPNAEEPYFMAWIGNADLMEQSSQPGQ